MFYKDERLVLFIDGPNLNQATKKLGFSVDFKTLREEFAQRGRLLRAYYYTALRHADEPDGVRKLVDWLSYNGFTVRSKPTKQFRDENGEIVIKGNLDVEICVDALELADKMDHAVFFTGDGDFRYLVETLQKRGVRVTVVSTIETSPAICADELRRQADDFIELDELRELIGQKPRSTVI